MSSLVVWRNQAASREQSTRAECTHPQLSVEEVGGAQLLLMLCTLSMLRGLRLPLGRPLLGHSQHTPPQRAARRLQRDLRA
jgi:hypothetical protein